MDREEQSSDYLTHRLAIIDGTTALDTLLNSTTTDGVFKLVIQYERQQDQAILEWLSAWKYLAKQSREC